MGAIYFMLFIMYTNYYIASYNELVLAAVHIITYYNYIQYTSNSNINVIQLLGMCVYHN